MRRIPIYFLRGGDGVMLFLYYILFFLGNAMLAVGMSFVGVWLSARSDFINAMRSHDGAEDISYFETEMDEAKRSMQKSLLWLVLPACVVIFIAGLIAEICL